MRKIIMSLLVLMVLLNPVKAYEQPKKEEKVELKFNFEIEKRDPEIKQDKQEVEEVKNSSFSINNPVLVISLGLLMCIGLSGLGYFLYKKLVKEPSNA